MDRFNHDTTRYDAVNAYWLASLSKFVYARDGQFNQRGIMKHLKTLGPGFRSVRVFDRNSAQAMLVEHDDFLVGAFRGTDESGDWLDNIKAFPTDAPLGKAHRGFYESMLDVFPDMEARLGEIRTARRGEHLGLWLTGHSLGGAMATLAAARLIERDEVLYGVYTFGQPRAGSRDFARTFNVEAKDRYFRFQNASDIVSRVPARVMGYSHVGTLYYIDQDGDISTDMKWWYRFLDMTTDVLSNLGDRELEGIEDHDIDRYIAAIAAAAREDLPAS